MADKEKEKEEILFDEGEDKKLPVFEDTDSEEKIIEKKIIKKELEKEIKADITGEAPKKESVPKEIPEMLFKAGSKIMNCPLFVLENEEAVLMAKHLSNIVGAQSSKMYSALVIVIVLISKISGCVGAIKNKVSGLTKKDDKGNNVPI